jgi:hypothetical protein
MFLTYMLVKELDPPIHLKFWKILHFRSREHTVRTF